MQRTVMKELSTWKNKTERKPLLIYGARQVGKTWLMKEFGKTHYQQTVYINFDSNLRMQKIFSVDLDIKRIIKELELEKGQTINPEDTLLIFDEIQECNRALVSLKYFCEDAPQYNIVAAGSFLGVAIHKGNSFPVGKVDMMTLYPLSFNEFLAALDEERFVRLIEDKDFSSISTFHGKYIERLKQYFYIGGMPEAVFSYAKKENLAEVREIQHKILNAYHLDFSKHINSNDIPKVGMLWDSIPAQLSREKKKFMYKDVQQGARARGYEDALRWLINSGLVYQISRVSLPNLPLISYQIHEHFKLYMLDIGLFSAMAGLDLKSYTEPNNQVFNHFKGALTEQFVLQEMRTLDSHLPIYYWTKEKGSAEIDFIIQKWDKIIPIEAKSSINLKAKSLKVYIEIFSPKTSIRFSLSEYKQNGNLYDIPLYMVGNFAKIIEQ